MRNCQKLKVNSVLKISMFSKSKLLNLIKRKNNTVWFSHHIPKTAGTSLYVSYVEAFGHSNILRIYDSTKVREFENGNIGNLSKYKIVHGHFKPRITQNNGATQIRRIVWIRDPIERSYSLMCHMIRHQPHKQEIKQLYKIFGDDLFKCGPDAFEYFVTSGEFSHLNRPYQSYFSEVNIDEIDFVGSIHRYDQDIKRLSMLLQCELNTFVKNPGQPSIKYKIIENRDRLMPYFLDEYQIVRNILRV